MANLIWLAIYAMTFGAMALICRADRKKATSFMDHQNEVTGQLQEELERIQREKTTLIANVQESQMAVSACRTISGKLSRTLERIYLLAGQAMGQPSMPITVGNADEDPLYVEISLCGPEHVAVYAVHRGFQESVSVPYSFRKSCSGIVVYEGTRVILGTLGRGRRGRSTGIARSADVQKITDAVRRYNESFHQSKGVAGVGAVKEEEPRGRDRRRHHGQGARDARRQGAPRRGSSEGSACPSS